MRMIPVQSASLPVLVTCCKCNARLEIKGEPSGVFADLDGKPFVDYYCPTCAERAQ